MLNFSQLTQDQFARPETLQAVKAEAFDLVDHLMVPESKKLALQLEDRLKTLPGLASQAPEIFAQYQKIIIFLKITALMSLDNNAVLELVQKNYLDSLEAGLDFNERMTGKMYSLPDLIWPEYAEQLAYALKQNTQKIGQNPIMISGETEQKPPTIQNWLSDFDRVLGPDMHTNIQQEEYLSKNPNAKNLDQKEKNKLRNVLKFYNNLKPIPSTVINQTLKELGAMEELPGEKTSEQFSQPYVAIEPTIVQAPKRYTRPEGGSKDQYLEPVEDASVTKQPQKSAPFIPPVSTPKPQQPAFTRPPIQPPQTLPQVFPSSPQTQPSRDASSGQARGGDPPLAERRGAETSSPHLPAQPTPSFSQPQTPPSSSPQSAPQPKPPSFSSQQTSSMPVPPRPTQTPAPPNQPTPSQLTRHDSYLEPIDIPEIITKPVQQPKQTPPSPIIPMASIPTPKPAPPKPEPDPRLQGNIVDLKGNVKNV